MDWLTLRRASWSDILIIANCANHFHRYFLVVLVLFVRDSLKDNLPRKLPLHALHLLGSWEKILGSFGEALQTTGKFQMISKSERLSMGTHYNYKAIQNLMSPYCLDCCYNLVHLLNVSFLNASVNIFMRCLYSRSDLDKSFMKAA